MPDLSTTDLFDLVVILVIVAVVINALRRGRGVLSVLGSALGALVLVWLASTALVTWGPAGVADQVRASTFADVVPLPHRAATELDHLVGAGSSVGD